MATLMRRQPLADFAGLHDQLDRMFERVVASGRGYSPAIDASTHDGVLEVRVPLPAAQQKKAVEITPKAG
jgi:HSP20 family molecular chaperone IbpA